MSIVHIYVSPSGKSWKYKMYRITNWIYITLNWQKTRANPAHGEVYSIQHNVIKFVSDLRQVGGFIRILRFRPPPQYSWNIVALNIFLHSLYIDIYVLKGHICQLFIFMFRHQENHGNTKCIESISGSN
jgi:hypothetical protein